MISRFYLLLLMAVTMAATGQPGGRYANLEIEKSADIVMPAPGAPVEFTIRVTNLGDYTAENVVIQDPIEPPLKIPEGRAASPTIGFYDADTGAWTIGDLGVDQSVTLVIPTIIDSDDQQGCVVNTAQFEHAQDTTPSNNRASMAVRLHDASDCADVFSGVSLTPGENEHIWVGGGETCG